MKQILVSTCGECPYSHFVGHNLQTHERYVSCTKLYGVPFRPYGDYNRDLYNNSIGVDKIRPDCPLSEVPDE